MMKLSDLPQDILRYELLPRLDSISIKILRYLFRLSEYPRSLSDKDRVAICKQPNAYIQYFIDQKQLRTNEISRYAAWADNLELMKSHLIEYPWRNQHEIITDAIKGHSSACLDYAVGHGCQMNPSHQTLAAQEGHLECFKQVIRFRFRGNVDSHILYILIQKRHLDCLEYYIQQGYSIENASAYAARFDDLELVKRFPLTAKTLEEAIQNENFEIFQYALEHDCPTHPKLILLAIEKHNFVMLSALCQKGVEFNLKDALQAAAYHNQMEAVEYLFEESSASKSDLPRFAAINGNLQMLQFLHERGCRFKKSVCTEAAKHGHLDCLKYAHVHGAPLSEESMNRTAERDHLDCLKYLLDHGGRCTLHTYKVSGPCCKLYLEEIWMRVVQLT